MESTYSDATSQEAKERLTSQYGYGMKRYGTIASWDTIFACWFLDFIGMDMAKAIKLTNHPAQLHYGVYDGPDIHSWNDAIRRSSELIFEAVNTPNNKTEFNMIHFGSGWGGVDIQICNSNLNVQTLGVTIDPKQYQLAKNLSDIYALTDRTKFLNQNFLELMSTKLSAQFNGGIAIESLCHVPLDQFDLLWKNINFVLKPNSKFAIHDWYLETTLTSDITNKLNIFLKGWDMAYCPTRIEMITAAERNGFKLSKDLDLTPKILTSAREIYSRAQFFKPIVKFFQNSKIDYIKSLGIEKPEALDFADTCLIQKELFENGTLSYRELVFEKL